jgi:hypothetical protein
MAQSAVEEVAGLALRAVPISRTEKTSSSQAADLRQDNELNAFVNRGIGILRIAVVFRR